MISIETFMYIMFSLWILNALSNIYAGINNSPKDTHYDIGNVIIGLIMLILSIVALMW